MQEKLEYRSFLGLLLFVSIGFFMILAPFFGVIFWAIAIAIVFAPIQNWFLKRLKRPNLSAFFTLILCSLVVVIPFLLVANSFLNQGLTVYEGLQSGKINLSVYFEEIKQAFPSVQHLLDTIGMDPAEMNQKMRDTALFISTFIAQHTISIGQGTLAFVVQIGILLYVAFFMLRDSKQLIRYLHMALPLGDTREALFFNKFSEVTRATIKGSLVVAMVQGMLGSFIFWALDISAPLLWGVIMTLLSLVPLIGAGLVWLPVALYLFAIGDFTSATILVVFGVAVIGLVDNILRPILIGRDTKLPDYLVLLSTLGGFTVFGMNGFVIGPLIAALFVTCWNIFITDFNFEENRLVDLQEETQPPLVVILSNDAELEVNINNNANNEGAKVESANAHENKNTHKNKTAKSTRTKS